jgi:hypothetical protein
MNTLDELLTAMALDPLGCEALRAGSGGGAAGALAAAQALLDQTGDGTSIANGSWESCDTCSDPGPDDFFPWHE